MIYFINCPEIMIPTSCLGWWWCFDSCTIYNKKAQTYWMSPMFHDYQSYHLVHGEPKRPDDSGEAGVFTKQTGGDGQPRYCVESESTSKWKAPGWGRGLYYTHAGIINQKITPKTNERPFFFRGCWEDLGALGVFVRQLVSVRIIVF